MFYSQIPGLSWSQNRFNKLQHFHICIIQKISEMNENKIKANIKYNRCNEISLSVKF
jgi:hypothetical protein